MFYNIGPVYSSSADKAISNYFQLLKFKNVSQIATYWGGGGGGDSVKVTSYYFVAWVPECKIMYRNMEKIYLQTMAWMEEQTNEWTDRPKGSRSRRTKMYTYIQTDRQTYTHTYIHTRVHAYWMTDRQTDMHTYIQRMYPYMDGQTYAIMDHHYCITILVLVRQWCSKHLRL